MDILGGIAAATDGIKLVNELRKIDREMDKAELKLRLVDLADKLLDAKQALQDAHEHELKLKREIEGLTAKLKQRAQLKDDEGLLFETDDEGKQSGEPFCNHCYVKEDRLYRLVPTQWENSIRYDCSNCRFMHLPGRGKRR